MFLKIIGGVAAYTIAKKAGVLPASFPSIIPSVDSISEALQNPQATIEDIEGQLQTIAGATPSAADTYMPMIQSAANAKGVDPIILIGIGWQESRWGTSTALDQPGPAGTGDFYARTPFTADHWEKVPGVILTMVPPNKTTRAWTWKKDATPPLTQVVIPGDGRGWGRGLMQLDYQLSQSVNWSDAASNILTGAGVFASDLQTMQSNFPQLSMPTLVLCALAAYNGGPSAVVSSIKQQLAEGSAEGDLDPDVHADGSNLTTTDANGQGYAYKVMSAIDSWGGLGAQSQALALPAV